MLSSLIMLGSAAVGPVPIDPDQWITTDDYPEEAVRFDQAGTVEFELIIDKRGIVQDCRVSRKSPFSLLDRTTCQLMMKRARFRPALDVSGRPASSTYSSKIKWAVPTRAAVEASAWASIGHLTIAEDGKIISCQDEIVGPVPEDTDQMCEEFSQISVEFLKQMRRDSGAGDAQFVFEVNFHIQGESYVKPDYETYNSNLSSIISSQFIISEKGEVRDCVIQRAEGNRFFHARICDNFFDGPFKAARDASGKPRIRVANGTIAISTRTSPSKSSTVPQQGDVR